MLSKITEETMNANIEVCKVCSAILLHSKI